MMRVSLCVPHLLGGGRYRAWQSYRKAGFTVCCSFRTRDRCVPSGTRAIPGQYMPTRIPTLAAQYVLSRTLTLCVSSRTSTVPGQHVPSRTSTLPGQHVTSALPGQYVISRTSTLPGQYVPSRTLTQISPWSVSSFANHRWYSTSPSNQGGQDSEPRDEKDSGKEKKSLASQDVRRLLALAQPEKWRLSAALGFLTVSSVITMSAPFFLGRVIDVIYSNPSEDFSSSLTTLCALLSGVFLCGAAANGARVYLMQTSGQRIVRQLRSSLFSSVLRQEVGFFDKTRTGELINRLSSDSVLIGRSVTENLSDGLRAVAQATVGVGMMFFVSPQLATFVLSVIPPLAVVGVIYGRYLRKVSKLTQDSLAEATQLAEERIGNVRTVRAFGKEMHEMKKYDSKVDYVLDLAYKEAMARAGFFGLTGLSGNFIVLAVLYKGGLLTGAAQMTVGELSSFLMYAFWVGISIGGLSSFYSELMKGFGAGTRIWQLLDRKPEMAFNEGEILTAEKFRGALEFRNVTFMYPSRPEAAIFQNLELAIPSGSVMAVVGPSGSGKSTLVSLLLRLYDPNSGSIHIDGHDVRRLNPLWLRSKIGTVSQEPVLFSCSISENIAYGAEDPSSVTREEIRRVADIANALSFVENFPKGFDTVVGEKGVLLSGGQKQRIAIARALLKDPRILLLDEATSALDAENEFLVQEALDRLMDGRTVLIIAHRLSTIQNADAVAVIDQGRVVECGKHEQLLKNKDGLFSKLMDKQATLLRSRDAILTAQ
ncbi:ATP-binding cassette sub-family B member 10, mitochondrial isoform X1 [Lithobates pipiens]